MLSNQILPFLNALSTENNKEWFTQNKTFYQEAQADFQSFVDQLIQTISSFDPNLQGLKAKDCVFRIYRDVRFSKDKTPYKQHFGAYMAAGGRKSKQAGYYIHIEPRGLSIAGGGIYHPEPAELKKLRNEFYTVPEELLEIIQAQDFKETFGGLWDRDKLKLAPKGFPKDFEHIDLLKYKSYITSVSLPDDKLAKKDLIHELAGIYQTIYPLNRLINDILQEE